MASRTTKDADAEADAVVILALLHDDGTSEGSGRTETLVVEQYRPPIDRFSVELPAGLIDKGESAAQAALRELKEETGYSGEVKLVSREVCMSPGMIDETVVLVVVEVDLADPANANPKQELEDGEFCVVKRVPLEALRTCIDRGSAMPIEGLYLLALGVEAGMKSVKAGAV